MDENVYPRIVMGLDVSTACIGVCIVRDDGGERPEILYMGHKTPKISRKIKGIEALFLKKQIFEDEFIRGVATAYGITDVVIEEPLLSSNNVNTVATLLRFNGMVSESIYRILGIIPNFISSYDARMYSFPELCCLRKYNKKGEEYPLKHIVRAAREGDIVLFGAYPFDVDKKTVMMNMVNGLYGAENMSWILNKKGEIAKENYDACDSLVCALAYVNINHHGVEAPSVESYEVVDGNNGKCVRYRVRIWDRVMDKSLELSA